jgi:hypothetical protein
MSYLIILILVAILMGVGLIVTLLVAKDTNAVYSGKKSVVDQVWMYIAMILAIVIVGLFYWI